jgi:hypothetical protein
VTTSLNPFDHAAERFERKGVSVYFRDPLGFADNCLAWGPGQGLTFYQRETLSDLNQHKRVAVRGPHGLGKTTTKAVALLWFATTRDALKIDWKVITTAGAWRQLEKFLWPEVHKWARLLRWDVIGRRPFDPINELQTLNLKLDYGAASAVATSHKELIEGAHADHLMYIFDEAKAISTDIFDAAEGAFATSGVGSVEAYALCQSTPGEPQGRFYDIHKRKPGLEDWKVRHVTADEATRAGRMSVQWREQRRRQWGEDSALYANRVLGEFHSSDEDAVIPLRWIELAVERWHVWNDSGRPEPVGRKILGTDVARGGADLTVVAQRQGDVVLDLTEANLADTVKIAELAMRLAPHQTDLHVVDVIGVGAGVVDTLRHRRANVIAFNAARANHMRDRSGEMGFKNNRSAMWWRMREALDPAFSPTLALPPKDQLIADLSAPKYKMINTKYVVEPKDEIRKRLGRSTDYGDAACQTLCTDMAFNEAPDEPPKVFTYAQSEARDWLQTTDLDPTGEVIPYAETGFDWISR